MDEITIEFPLFPATREMLITLVDLAVESQSYEIPYEQDMGGMRILRGETDHRLPEHLHQGQIQTLESFGYIRRFRDPEEGAHFIKYAQVLPSAFSRAKYEKRPALVKFILRNWHQIRRSTTFVIAVTAFILSAVSIILNVLQIAGELGF